MDDAAALMELHVYMDRTVPWAALRTLVEPGASSCKVVPVPLPSFTADSDLLELSAQMPRWTVEPTKNAGRRL